MKLGETFCVLDIPRLVFLLENPENDRMKLSLRVICENLFRLFVTEHAGINAPLTFISKIIRGEIPSQLVGGTLIPL